jgi:Zn-dependent peptidase ImmA (M78 family)/DNA-binding XRE family transcriptional regulator
MASANAFINPAMLRWARARVGIDAESAARAVGVKPQNYEAWEGGETQPTFKQAQAAAKVLLIPFGFLFLKEPPAGKPELPDLRTIGGMAADAASMNLQETVQHAMQRQEWFIEYLQEQGARPLPFVGKFDLDTDPKIVAADIRKVLDIDVEQGQRTWEKYYQNLIDAAESAGILVMRSGIVGSNTHRKLDVAEFRGFAISHPLAPVIFINSSDAPSARLFTFLHELAHIWIGSSGISNISPSSHRREEVVCNAIAGEFLAPAELFLRKWQESSENLKVKVLVIARQFHVSSLVIIRRALDMGLIDRTTYNEFYLSELAAFRSMEGGGGNYYRNAGAKNSPRFSKAVIAEAFSGRLLLRDAGRLLGVQPSKIRDYAGMLGS